MIIGKNKNSIDSKNRICIPHKFRGDFGGRCILTKDFLDDCLNLYPIDAWEEFCEKIEKLPSVQMRRMRQLVYSNSDEVEIDSQGRIILNQNLAGDVGLLNEKEAMIIGNKTFAQIWNVSKWEEFDAALNAKDSKESVINDLLEMGF